ncbi:MAG TPA: riboflavin synthase [Spirochaetota bacterium]|nr:riboflavin synthase [Spirochaetota bacterium]HOL57345.1 riboflavin synthase [Spirochaetota bacterium]HPP04358.1 riboflavin synthase [Spirochaetota bacterium]
MFTGIIEELGILKEFKYNGDLIVQAEKVVKDSKIGDSISVNGVCLTVTEINKNFLKFHLSETTRKIGRFKEMKSQEILNLERAMQATDRFGGHIVSGHIDGLLRIINIQKRGDDTFFEFLYPKEFRNMFIPKGSVAIDGISLTISDVMSSSFVVTVIPHTLNNTNLKTKRVNDMCHFEVDIFLRYINNILSNGVYYGKNF